MNTRQKLSLLGLAAVAVIAMMLLASSLEKTELATAQVLYFKQVTPTPVPRGDVFSEFGEYQPYNDNWWPLAVIVTILVIMVIWDERTRSGAIASLIAVGIIYIIWIVVQLFARPPDSDDTEVLPIERLEELISRIPREIPPVPDWLVLLITVFGLGIVVGVAYLLYRRFAPPVEPDLREKLARDLQYSIDALEAGADYRGTVTACYEMLLRTLSTERGISRKQHLTPNEFSQQLADFGVPEQQISTLTSLFESARYSDQTPDNAQLKSAQACLQSILDWLKTSNSNASQPA